MKAQQLKDRLRERGQTEDAPNLVLFKCKCDNFFVTIPEKQPLCHLCR